MPIIGAMGGYEPLDWTCTPSSVVARWPLDRPLAVLHVGRAGEPSRTIVAEPRRVVAPRDVPAALDALAGPSEADAPLDRGWIAALSYELGRVLEPAVAVGPPPRDDRGWPAALLAECPDTLVHDGVTGRWHAVGRTPTLRRRAAAGMVEVGALVPSMSRLDHRDAVGAILSLIAAGDIFQANLTYRLSAPFAGSTRRLLAASLDVGAAPHGAYLELPGGRCLLSMSPELFLDADLTSGAVVTRPIKGTRPASATPGELLESAKDVAELAMIVDLMRNDLGRVCVPGSVRVPRGRIIETHPTVQHGVGEVAGRLREGTGAGALLAATFPPGSVTGAPKIRAMQVIESLEPIARGPYCGAIGLVRPGRGLVLNVAIRTVAITGTRTPGDWSCVRGALDYGVGGGIVADSQAEAEWAETEVKAALLRRVLEACTADRQPAGVARELTAES